jgi:signal transduction histidine kinase
MSHPLLNDIKKIIAFSDLPEEHLLWILDHSEYREYEDGTLITKPGDAVDWMWILLEGKYTFYMDMNGTKVHFFDFENDASTGGIGGLMPYSRMKGSPGYAYAVGKTRGLMLHKKYFHELEQLNPDLIQKLIGYMTERARAFATRQLQHEKVSALGKLSAGIAHELNNPAAAINRISSELIKRLMLNYDLTEKLLKNQVNSSQICDIRSMAIEKEKLQHANQRLSSMKRMEMEDEISDWLEQNGFEQMRSASETFTDAGFTINDFEAIRSQATKEMFVPVLQWTENLLSSQQLIKDLENASGRISRLVGAIKSHVHMDRTNDMQPTNINNDIENTLTLLGYKIREKNITVTRKFNMQLPEVDAYVGELNQVWTNIIDNAIYAMDKQGELTIETDIDKKNVVVRITDNGSGIPNEILSRVFDPFFTTKKVGDGTGIGLDLVKRIVTRHNGEVKVASAPGQTEFSICFPLTQNQNNNQ